MAKRKVTERTIQIRHVPYDVHRTLSVRAAEEGLSLSDYALRQLERSARRPTRAEWFAQVAAHGPAILDPEFDSAALIRELRGPLGEP